MVSFDVEKAARRHAVAVIEGFTDTSTFIKSFPPQIPALQQKTLQFLLTGPRDQENGLDCNTLTAPLDFKRDATNSTLGSTEEHPSSEQL